MAWGALAWDWALLQEPLNANSFDVVQQLTDVGPGVRLLDLACGSGLALQHAEARGAVCHGVDASRALLDIAARRAPSATLRFGDMAKLPHDDGSFDVVTTVNGVQYGSDDVLLEASRVLTSGGRFAMAFWSDPMDYAGYFAALTKCSPAAPSAPLNLSDAGAAEGLVGRAGLEVVERGEHDVVCLYRSTTDAIDALESGWPGVGRDRPRWPRAGARCDRRCHRTVHRRNVRDDRDAREDGSLARTKTLSPCRPAWSHLSHSRTSLQVQRRTIGIVAQNVHSASRPTAVKWRNSSTRLVAPDNHLAAIDDSPV
jgi:SAM-dependent methyltransferase